MSRKKTVWVRIGKIAALVIPVVLLILLFPVNDYDDSVRIRNFYLETPNSLDVVVMGSSEDYAGYSPVLAYEEYGFTSYPYVFSANDFSIFEEQLDEVLRVQSPKMIVVNIAELINLRTHDDTVLREFLAGIPLSWHKIQMIREYGDSEEILSYYFPFIVNHGKADRQTLADYVQTNAAVCCRGYSLLKGTITYTGTGEYWDGPYVTPRNTSGDTSIAQLQPEVIEQCRDVLDVCRKHPDIQFVFINLPHRITTESRYREYQEVNAAGALIEKAGFDYINLESMTDEIGIVPEADFYNNHHMNLYGQYKATRFLCDLLTRNYDIEPRAISPKDQARWDTCVEFSKLYYQLFEEGFRSRQSVEDGRWLKEDASLFKAIEEMKRESKTN